MSMFISLCVAVALTCTSLLGIRTLAPVEVNPFDASNHRCVTIPNLYCAVVVSHGASMLTVGEVVSVYTKRPFSEIRQLNGWKEWEVTPDTVLPEGKWIVLWGSIWNTLNWLHKMCRPVFYYLKSPIPALPSQTTNTPDIAFSIKSGIN